MEAFVVLFFTFLCQHIQTLQKSAASAFSWLQNDCTLDQIREYFPPQVIQGINPNVENPIQLRLSVILNAFHQFLDRFEEIVFENRSLASRAKLLQDVMKRSANLEDEVQEYRRKQAQLGAHRIGRTHDRAHDICKQCEREQAGLRSKLEALKKQVLELEPLKITLARSEGRNKQLVEVTQQWAIECQEKDSHIAVVETQNQQLRQERELFKKKLAKYKKQASVDREQKVSDCQFEELREELGYRRELHDKVVSERDRAEEQVKLLTAENCVLRRQVEEDKDEVEELKDRVGNFKVQMLGREPTVKEFGLVIQENRQLREENERLMKENSALSDEIVAYKTQLDEHAHATNARKEDQSRVNEHPQTPPHDKQQPAAKLPVKTQAMVTGYSIPQHSKPPVVANGATRSSEELQHDSRAINIAHNPTRPSSTPYQRSPTPPAGSYQRSPTPPSESYRRSPTPPTGSYWRSPTLPTGSQQNGGSDQQLPSDAAIPATITIPNGHFTPEAPLQNGLPSISLGHGRDYTTEIRYPNQSGILVQPLHNDDISILQQEGVFSGGSSSSPRFYDPTPLLPAKTVPTSSPPLSPAAASHYNPNQPEAIITTPGLTSPLISFTSNERKCPVCQHVFLTLGEREFQSHVAGCFK